METTTIRARWLISGDDTLEYPSVTLDGDGIILKIEQEPSDDEDDTLAPSLFDVHTHGAAGRDVMEATEESLSTIGHFLASRGVGHYLPTTVTAAIDQTLRSLEGMATYIERESIPGVALPLGVHLEGPFLSHVKRGVHPAVDLQSPSIDLFDRMVEAARGHIRLMTVAPELPGALDLIRHASQRGILVSIGHTNASAAETRAAISAGAKSATHTFNAMRPMDHREPGVLGVVLDDNSIFAELICDGVHVAPEPVRLWWKAKGPHRGLLVTDSMAATGMPDGAYSLGGISVQVKDGRCLANGVLAGSILTLDRAIYNLRRIADTSLPAAIGLATQNPSALLGRPGLASIRIGEPAHLARFSRDGRLISSYIAGKLTVPDS